MTRCSSWSSSRCGPRKKGRRAKTMTINIHGVPLKAHGQQPGSVFSKYTEQRQHSPLVALWGQTGHMLARSRAEAA